MFVALKKAPVVPLIHSDDTELAKKTVQALVDGGLRVVEVVLRTDAAMDCLEAIAKDCPDAITGAGTVLSLDHAKEVIKRGATFVVSPGLDEEVVKYCQSKNVPILPGIMTASELQKAYNLGLRTVKFFPAGLAGGVPMLKAFTSVFRDMSFMPTGGVSAANLADYLAVPKVVACGGSWLTPSAEIAVGNYAAVTKLASEAVNIARSVRG
ncbi:bifunctional 4-hydroxy-2-oxoglutarate aldolase/2-dehydro-3-deoxy-phosphogluconate aldolase [Robiginitomaculum antarcticum]|uniref:bifunctional 4-hydroxy-2-oxoglutarate aldolase/2-dehydro-3-deoxy-phosphogluconate aldolase n=1 Tax=Robiginitomaculum antarcticum TaxID=437507 RepID=UPI00036889C8|nr:bifunctional 4-hydroxy-2-oxoglutarate aldolase/2-dehydro-3-deoxy-phosphogluconate aldolase [Robiginitomaculum antarcticum]